MDITLHKEKILCRILRRMLYLDNSMTLMRKVFFYILRTVNLVYEISFLLKHYDIRRCLCCFVIFIFKVHSLTFMNNGLFIIADFKHILVTDSTQCCLY